MRHIMIFILLATLAAATPNWYAVQDWERDVCSVWGGIAQANSGTTTGNNYLSEMVITLQAERVRFQIDTANYTTQYKIAWYFAPYQDDYIYSVKLEGGDQRLFADEEEVNKGAGQSGFEAFYENETMFDEAILEYCKSDYSACGSLTVPVVE